ncbi:sensor histidine kinase [Mucilaginibacter myungsuensis]|uniref:Histidine kinase n=1 Tax=Mucilaginibacter myungsuensis TaxID=649104 RepID=A0A929KVE0_9SPHI|nr:histidine kinase [Mucilaginibacter myungsuensis]MBE9661138.1 histidine kinase [Mucilaginibacter myungsuensis]MDN3597283.1 histidine kinase [Mucilaginibacter myungsuensis]
MDKSIFRTGKRSYLQTNIRYGAIGVLVGIVIVALKFAFTGKVMSLPTALINIMFSVVITLSITNSLFIFEYFLFKDNSRPWLLITVYYVCNALGMLIGIEISYAIVSLIFGDPFNFLRHYREYQFSGMLVLIVGTFIYFYHVQKARMEARLKEKELDLAKLMQLKTQAELQTLQSKINPHFLYNSLNSIASLIHEDADKAEDMTLKLSKLFRYSINSQQENMASVREEMEIVNTYLDIEKVRFGERINFLSTIAPDAMALPIPRFLIQPLVENSLKHGLNNKASDGRLEILIDTDGTEIFITIADNGQPFPDDINMGYGLQSTYDKLALLYGEDYRLHISNLPQKHIKITIPVKAS